jgi:hypothetical protein
VENRAVEVMVMRGDEIGMSAENVVIAKMKRKTGSDKAESAYMGQE